MSERGTRLQVSVVTFGPVGRVVATAVVLAVLAWFVMFDGIFGVVGAVIWIGWVMRPALRDIWRRAELPATDLTRLRDTTTRELEQQQRPSGSHPAFDQESDHPKRW
jgi:hypothetical protein